MKANTFYLLFFLVMFSCSDDDIDITSDIELMYHFTIDGTDVQVSQIGIKDLNDCSSFCAKFDSLHFPERNILSINYNSILAFTKDDAFFELHFQLRSRGPIAPLTTAYHLEHTFYERSFELTGGEASYSTTDSTTLFIRLCKKDKYGNISSLSRVQDCEETVVSKYTITDVRMIENVEEFNGDDIILVTADFDITLCSDPDEITSIKGGAIQYFRTK